MAGLIDKIHYVFESTDANSFEHHGTHGEKIVSFWLLNGNVKVSIARAAHANSTVLAMQLCCAYVRKAPMFTKTIQTVMQFREGFRDKPSVDVTNVGSSWLAVARRLFQQFRESRVILPDSIEMKHVVEVCWWWCV